MLVERELNLPRFLFGPVSHQAQSVVDNHSLLLLADFSNSSTPTGSLLPRHFHCCFLGTVLGHLNFAGGGGLITAFCSRVFKIHVGRHLRT